MPRSFRIERESDMSSYSSNNPFGSRPPTREQLANQELVANNQKLQARVQKLNAAYQMVEQQNVLLRDRCLRLQNRVDELKMHLSDIKVDVSQRVAPLQLVAGHLFEVAAFLESLDNSIDVGNIPPPPPPTSESMSNCNLPIGSEKSLQSKQSSLEAISEVAEGW